MYILGIGGLGYADSSAALLRDGRVLCAAAEGRFSSAKHRGGFPHRAVRFCLERAGIAIRDLSGLAVAQNGWLAMRDKVLRWYGEDFLRSRTAKVYHVFREESHLLVAYLQAFDAIAAEGVEVQEVSHEAGHMAAAFYGSPFPSAAILVVDGRGEISTSGIAKGDDRALQVYAVSHMPDSPGLLYTLVADYLGYSDLDDEFRLISMSAGATPRLLPRMRALVRVSEEGSCRLNPDYFGYHQGRAYLSERFTEEFGPPRDAAAPLEERHRDLAASLHTAIVEAALAMARIARERSGESRLAIGGTLAQDWALTGSICESGLFREVYVPPSAGDEGLAIGAALHVHHTRFRGARAGPILRADFGPIYKDDEIASELARWKIRAERPPELVAAVAERIASGQIVGWFQGAAEFGPRALGHRSILANPCDPTTRARLVASVKTRSEWHPFGLSIPREAAPELLQEIQDSPFLERTGRLRPEARRRLPAVAAQEGLVRYQTVEATHSPLFHELLKAVGRRTGVPALLNTSLNEPGAPIATTPREAVACLYTTGLDALALGPFLLSK
jgi:carbamoyltransferase